MKVIRLIKILSKTYRKVLVDKNLQYEFPVQNGLKQGDTVSPLLFNFAFEYAIRKIQEICEGLEFSGTHELVVFGEDVII
jgi:hypothetical protein